MQLIKYIFYSFFLFCLLYFEDRINFGFISLSNLWKLLTVIVLIFVIISKKNKIGYSRFDKCIFLLFFSFILNSNSIITISDIEELVLILMLPISYYSFFYLYKFNPKRIKRSILFLSTFLILSAIPFLLDLIEPVGDYKDELMRFAESYKLNSSLLIGFFKHPSLSSKVFVFSTIIVWAFGIREKSFNKFSKFIFLLIFLLGVYEVYRAFTRTGWIMLILFYLLFLIFTSHYSKLKKIVALSLITISLIIAYNSNESIQNRISSKRTNDFNSIEGITKISSGRDLIMFNALESVLEEGNLALYIGLGKNYALIKTDGALAHNRFIEIFQYGGLFSLIIYLFYLFYLFREISKRKSKSFIYVLSISLYLIMIFSQIPSHGLPIWADIILGGVLALNRMDYELQKNIRFILNG